MGFMRDQKVARVMFYPFQFNQVTGELRYYSEIKVRVNLNTDIAGAAVSGGRRKAKDNAYEKLLRGVLINHDQVNSGKRE